MDSVATVARPWSIAHENHASRERGYGLGECLRRKSVKLLLARVLGLRAEKSGNTFAPQPSTLNLQPSTFNPFPLVTAMPRYTKAVNGCLASFFAAILHGTATVRPGAYLNARKRTIFSETPIAAVSTQPAGPCLAWLFSASGCLLPCRHNESAVEVGGR